MEHDELPDLDKSIAELETQLDDTKDEAVRDDLAQKLKDMKAERGLLRARIDPPFAREDELAFKAQEAAVELDADIP